MAKFSLILIFLIAASTVSWTLAPDNVYTETASVRKYFFTFEKDWHKFVNKSKSFGIAGDDVRIFCSYLNNTYHIIFYPSRDDPGNFFSFGSMLFQFDKDRNIQKVIVFYQSSSVSLPQRIPAHIWQNQILPEINSVYTKKILNSYYKQSSGRGDFLLNESLILKNPLIKLPLWSIFNQTGFDFYHNESFISFENQPENLIDIVLLGKPYRSDIPVYYPVERLKTATLASVFSVLERNNLDKNLLLDSSDIKMKQLFIDQIILTSINEVFVKDGARNQFGEYVTIEDAKLQKNSRGLNCSGFVKEIADNYIRRFNSDFKWLSIDILKKKRSDNRDENSYKQYEKMYNPLFGLDWGKNIAESINRECGFTQIKSTVLLPDGRYPYHQSSGYLVSDLKNILFIDRQKDPTWFYILVFNRIRNKKPVIPEFYHLSVVVPYVEDGQFKIRVFESNDETGFDQLTRIHAGEKVAIIKIPIPYIFY